jgi:NAD(P)-dependent dehydrogenase (short-subunit alcohol dehydrogenase family)
MVNTPASVVIAGSGELMARLAVHYRGLGASVSEVPFDGGVDPEQAAAEIVGPVDLLIVADAFKAAPDSAADLSRAELATASHRLTYLPFRIAALLKPQLAAAGGRAVLISDPAARMIATSSASPYLDRPFRAAAHALWRCLSVEWKDDGITCGIVGLESGWGAPVEAVAAAVAARDAAAFPVEMTDASGRALGW